MVMRNGRTQGLAHAAGVLREAPVVTDEQNALTRGRDLSEPGHVDRERLLDEHGLARLERDSCHLGVLGMRSGDDDRVDVVSGHGIAPVGRGDLRAHLSASERALAPDCATHRSDLDSVGRLQGGNDRAAGELARADQC